MFRSIILSVACLFALAPFTYADNDNPAWAVGTWTQNYDWGTGSHGITTWVLNANGTATETSGGLQLQGAQWEYRKRDRDGKMIIRVYVDRGTSHFEFEWPVYIDPNTRRYWGNGNVYLYDPDHRFNFFGSNRNVPASTGTSNVTKN
jgi:hypothetical protein